MSKEQLEHVKQEQWYFDLSNNIAYLVSSNKWTPWSPFHISPNLVSETNTKLIDIKYNEEDKYTVGTKTVPSKLK